MGTPHSDQSSSINSLPLHLFLIFLFSTSVSCLWFLDFKQVWVACWVHLIVVLSQLTRSVSHNFLLFLKLKARFFRVSTHRISDL
jgi:hypothetical protein